MIAIPSEIYFWVSGGYVTAGSRALGKPQLVAEDSEEQTGEGSDGQHPPLAADALPPLGISSFGGFLVSFQN